MTRIPEQIPLSAGQKPIGTAKFQEPVYKLGVFQNRHIEVTVKVYGRGTFGDSTIYCFVQFGEQPFLKVVPQTKLSDITPFSVDNQS